MKKSWLATVLAILLLVGVAPDAQAARNSGAGIVDVAVFNDYSSWDSPSFGVVALRSDGTIVTDNMGDSDLTDEELRAVESWKDIIQISSCSGTLAALRADGTVLAVGNDESGQCRVEDWRNVTCIVCTVARTFGLLADGTVVCTGGESADRYFVPFDASAWTGVKKLICAFCSQGEYLLGLMDDGTVMDICVTYDDSWSEVGRYNGWSGKPENIAEISSSGWLHTALRTDGTVICKGTDRELLEDGLSGWADIVQVCSGDTAVVGLCSDGTVVAVPLPEEEPYTEILRWTGIKRLYMGTYNTVIGLRADGTLKVAADDAMHPKQEWADRMRGWTDIVDVKIDPGERYVIGWKADGTLVSVGVDFSPLWAE